MRTQTIHHGIKLFLFGLVVALFFVVISTATSLALTTTPNKMNFQGRLTDASGNPLNGTYDMQFKLYDAATSGTLKWAETRTAANTNPVTVTNGLFSVKLGEGTLIAPSTQLNAVIAANPTLYFEVTVGADAPMTPRSQVATSAYAFNSDTLDGLDSTSFGQVGSANSWTAAQNVNVASAAAFQVQNGSTSLLNVDTTNSIIKIGAADSTAQVLVVDTNSADPGAGATSINGAMYYNTTLNKFRCYQGAWVDCVSSATTLQQAYDASGSPATITTTAAKGIKIVAGAAPTSDLFSVDNSANPTVSNNADGISVNYAGGAAAVEGAGLRVDYAPGSTSGGTWSGVRIVANATGPASGVTSYGIKLEGPTAAGAGTEIGLRVASGFDIGVDIASGGLQLSSMNDPVAPAVGNLKVYAQTNAGRTMLKMRSSSGLQTTLQPFLGTNRIYMAQPFNNATTFATGSYFGGAAPTIKSYTVATTTAVATFTGVTVDTTGLFGSIKRGKVYTSTGTGTTGGIYGGATSPVLRGNGSSIGGFYYVARFGISTYRTGLRTFAGLTSSTAAPANGDPSALANMMGVGCDTADTSFSFMSNDGTGTATKVALGASFPCNTSSTDMYELRLFSAPSGSSIYYSLARLNTGDYIEGTTSVAGDMPVNTTLLYPRVYINNNSAAQAALDFATLYVETDN